MTSKVNPEIPIELDKLRHLRFDVNAMVIFEELTGLNLLKPSVQKKLQTNISVSEFRAFLYACLVYEDESLTLMQVGSFINSANMKEIASKIIEAQLAAAPDAKEVEETAPLVKKKPRRG